MYAKGEVAAGLYPALFKEAFSRMGVRTELTAVPWKRALDDTDAGRAGTGGIYQNSERLKKYDFSEPFYEERLAIFVPTGKEFGFDKMEDLYGKSFNVLSGWSYGDDFDAAVKAGNPVPAAVLADYPDLRPAKAEAKAEPKAAAKGAISVEYESPSGLTSAVVFRSAKYSTLPDAAKEQVDAALKQAIIDFCEGTEDTDAEFDIGQDVIRRRLYKPAVETDGVYDVTRLEIGTTATTVETNIIISPRELANFDTSRITVVSTPVTPS